MLEWQEHYAAETVIITLSVSTVLLGDKMLGCECDIVYGSIDKPGYKDTLQ